MGASLDKLRAAKAAHAVGFIENLTHTKGDWARKPFTLEPWQRSDLIEPIFGDVDQDGLRRVRTAFVELPRKNGKSELAAAIALYLLLGDGEEGAEIYSAGVDRNQAMQVFNYAVAMIRNDRALDNLVTIYETTKRIVYHQRNSFYMAISREHYSKHGYNAHGIIFDEIHAHRDRSLWDVLTTSTGSRSQPLIFGITTAGDENDKETIWHELHQYAKAVLKGEIEDPSFFAYIKAAPPKSNWRDEKVWHRANPALGTFRSIQEMRNFARRAEHIPALVALFKRLYLGMPVSLSGKYINTQTWDKCAISPLKNAAWLEYLKGRTCYGGLDLASTQDLNAFVLVFEPKNLKSSKGRYDVLAWYWVPQEGIVLRADRDKVPYPRWAEEGHITGTPGNVTYYAEIQKTILECMSLFDLQEVAYDRWGATQLSQDLGDAGLTMIPMGQGWASMSEPTKNLLRMVNLKRMRHNSNPVLRWNIDNMIVDVDPRENVAPNKKKSTERIDGAVALIMALDRAFRHKKKKKSVYEERGIIHT